MATIKIRVRAFTVAFLLLCQFTPSFAVEDEDTWGVTRGGELHIGGRGTTPGEKPTEPTSSGGSGDGGGAESSGVVAPEDPYEYYAHYGCPLPGTDAADDYCSLNRACNLGDGKRGVVHVIHRRLKTGGEWERTSNDYCAAPDPSPPKMPPKESRHRRPRPSPPRT